jgi:leader peptidase (prepilin peptidase)/N-methyltransferase
VATVRWLVLGYAALLGAIVGSFLNVCVHRWPLGQSVVRPRSHCPTCDAPIAWYDNIPLLSWLLLRGRCRRCGERISVQYPLVELAGALIWLVAAARFGASIEGLRMAVFLTVLLGIALTDAEHMVIPDQLSLGGLVAGLALAAAPRGFGFLQALAGAAVGYGFFWLIKLGAEKAFRKPALGVGDIHMMAMAGAFVGVTGALLTVLIGSLLGLLVGVPLNWWRGRLTFMGTYLPLGTFLAMGAAVTFVWGDAIVDLYLHLALGLH